MILLLAESDHDLYSWVTGTAAAPAEFAPLIAQIVAGLQGPSRLNLSRLDNIREFPRYC